MSHYHDSDDLKILGEFKTLAPAEFKGFVEIGPYCLDAHTRNAKKAGATRREVAETSLIAAALRAGAAVTHGALAVKLFHKS
jgi:AhpD family alkylhydroperoxidase